jgi:hypothetical protein
MEEIPEEPTVKLGVKSLSKREEYLDLIDRLLEECYSKALSKYCKNSEKTAWVRAATGLVEAGTTLMRDADLDELVERLDALEKNVGEKKHETEKHTE